MLLLPLPPAQLALCIVCLDETAETEVLLDDNVIDSSHDESDLGSIGSTGEVGVDLLGLMLIQADESIQDVVACQSVIITAFVVGEVVLHWADWEFLLETINLIQEQNDRSLDEPSRVADGIEEGQGFLHTVDGLILE